MNPPLIEVIDAERVHLHRFRAGQNGVNSGLIFYLKITEVDQFKFFGPETARLDLIETWLDDLGGYFQHLYDFESRRNTSRVLDLSERRIFAAHLLRYWKTVLAFSTADPATPSSVRGMLDASGAVLLTEAQIRGRVRGLMMLGYSLDFISKESAYQRTFAG